MSLSHENASYTCPDVCASNTKVGVLQSTLYLERERANFSNRSSDISSNSSSSSKINDSKSKTRSNVNVMTGNSRTKPLQPSSKTIVHGEVVREARGTMTAAAAGAMRLSSSSAINKGKHFPLKCVLKEGKIRQHDDRVRPRTTPARGTPSLALSLQTRRRGNSGGRSATTPERGRRGVDGVEFYDDDLIKVLRNEDVNLELSPFAWRDDPRREYSRDRGVGDEGGEVYVLDLDGRGGNGLLGSGTVMDRAGDNMYPDTAMGTPFQRWKEERGIFTPGVAEEFGKFRTS